MQTINNADVNALYNDGKLNNESQWIKFLSKYKVTMSIIKKYEKHFSKNILSVILLHQKVNENFIERNYSKLKIEDLQKCILNNNIKFSGEFINKHVREIMSRTGYVKTLKMSKYSFFSHIVSNGTYTEEFYEKYIELFDTATLYRIGHMDNISEELRKKLHQKYSENMKEIQKRKSI